MNLVLFFQEKTRSLLTLRTGCFIIGFVYVLDGFLYFLQEIVNAVETYSRHPSGKADSLIVYDLSPVVVVIMGVYFIYGVYKKEPFYVFQGVPVITFCLFIDLYSVFEIIIEEVKDIENFLGGFFMNLVAYSALHFVAIIAILNYKKQITFNNPERMTEEGRANGDTFHEVENTMASIQPST